MENFLNLRLSKRTETKSEGMRDVFDIIGSEKFKAPSLLASLAGMLSYNVQDWKPHDSTILRLYFLVKYDLLSSI